MKTEIIINNTGKKKLSTAIIDKLDINEPHVVYIRPWVKKRSESQKRLYFLQIEHVAKKVGYAAARLLHEQMKEEYLMPIFVRDDPGYAELYYLAKSNDMAKAKLKELTSTNNANIKQMSEYMEKLKYLAWDMGVDDLPVPEDLRWVAV
jgi:hypothetical protein